MPRTKAHRCIRSVVVIAGLASLGTLARCRSQRATSTPPSFVGSARCADCHRTEYAAWHGSQHSMAMQRATPATVLGRFDGASFVNGGVSYTFSRRGDTAIVKTIGSAGSASDFPIRYTFGVFPLQQYLVELRAGHVQALLVAWDARPAQQGGQRWFSLAPGAEASHAERFHWTGSQYNWNYMCADCHSTAVRKQYEPATDSFHTSFSEINVACEACHGPGSRHASWGRYPGLLRRLFWHDDGLQSKLTERRGVVWSIDSASGLAHRSVPRTSEREIETCTQCHARRNHIADGYTAGAPLLDYYVPLPLLSDMYYPDGQQLDEVYTVASFQQSKMYSFGVTCADCHDPHTQKLRRPGNQVCGQCHRAAKYDTTAHHHHATTGAGAQCVSCHMPDTTYMQIDRRHDHSLRIPRPDLSISLGVPNACNRCHTEHDAKWAVSLIRYWYPNPNPGFQRFAHVFASDDRGEPGATDSLGVVANDATEPWIVRASALARLGARPGAVALEAARKWSRDRNPVIRFYALTLLETMGAQERLSLAPGMLTDERRAIRQEAAWVLAPFARSLDSTGRRAFDRAASEFVASQRYNADRAPSRLRLVSFYAQLGRLDTAATEFHAAARLDSAAASQFAQALSTAAPTSPEAAALLRAIGITIR
ncbi:MAG TPA: cytochrome c3 family protein [Gemmatimonadaceae bacterium]|nr:cytochrome c3 family protein [Gemmatimonadaceae bacterium]